jgi:hypothetical protein
MNTFKKFFVTTRAVGYLVGAVLACEALAPLPAGAQVSFTGSGTASGATNSYALIPGDQGTPKVTGFDATVRGLDVTNIAPATAKIRFLTAVTEKINQVTASSSNTATIIYAQTNGLAAGDVLVVRGSGGRQTRHEVVSVATGAITITPALSFGLTNITSATGGGNGYWKMTNTANYNYSHLINSTPYPYNITNVANVSFSKQSTSPLFTGTPNAPCSIELVGTQTNTLNAVVGHKVVEKLTP